MTPCNLGGKGVLVTRAAHQAAGLCRLIESAGGRPQPFPALEILPVEKNGQARRLLTEGRDLMLFVSPNAVRFGCALAGEDGLHAKRFGVVGRATADSLAGAGYTIDLIPDGRYDSEGVLALSDLQHMAGQEVVIVRGEGGRPLLADTLRARGAKVEYAEVYRRARPNKDVAPLLRAWHGSVDLVTVTSIEVLENLVAMLGAEGWPLLRSTPLMVISERMREAAARQGFEKILLAPGADDETLLVAICDWNAG